MEPQEKTDLLNQLIQPFGFFYNSSQDIFTSRLDAWQREFGYCTLYDRSAAHFNMVFDCEPIYFSYDDQTWLIEFWKGQYGINTGAEVGIYYVDGLIEPEQYKYVQFQSVPENRMLPISMRLKRQGTGLFALREVHWWLTGFRTGAFSCPKELELEASITFPEEAMLYRFVDALHKAGYEPENLCVCCLTVTISFTHPHSTRHSPFTKIQGWLAQLQNRIFVRLFQWITRPFSCTEDRMLYLYYFLPYAFRRTVGIRKYHSRRIQK